MSELWDIVCDMLLCSSRGGSAEQIIRADAEEVCQLSDRGRGDVSENFPVVNGLPGDAHLSRQIILAQSTTAMFGYFMLFTSLMLRALRMFHMIYAFCVFVKRKNSQIA